jgi:hypothetical protein
MEDEPTKKMIRRQALDLAVCSIQSTVFENTCKSGILSLATTNAIIERAKEFEQYISKGV